MSVLKIKTAGMAYRRLDGGWRGGAGGWRQRMTIAKHRINLTKESVCDAAPPFGSGASTLKIKTYFNFPKFVFRGFLRVIRFPPHLHRLMVSAKKNVAKINAIQLCQTLVVELSLRTTWHTRCCM